MTFNLDDALRYLGAAQSSDGLLQKEMLHLAETLPSSYAPKFVWRVFPLSRTEHGVFLEHARLLLSGKTAETMLAQCDRAVLLACTLGAQFESDLRRLQSRDMSRAVMMDACGSAWVDSVCDTAAQQIADHFPDRFLTDRFSPGYGDLPLELQSALCAVLDAPRRLGLYVTSSCLLTPTKSITAVIGLSDTPQAARIRGCHFCTLHSSCTLQKEGGTCHAP